MPSRENLTKNSILGESIRMFPGLTGESYSFEDFKTNFLIDREEERRRIESLNAKAPFTSFPRFKESNYKTEDLEKFPYGGKPLYRTETEWMVEDIKRMNNLNVKIEEFKMDRKTDFNELPVERLTPLE